MALSLVCFYKYVTVPHPEVLVATYLKFCSTLNLRGSIYFATEGINGSLTGDAESIAAFKKKLTAEPSFADLWFKEEVVPAHAFNKMKVKLKKEICAFKHDVDLAHSGAHLSAADLDALYEKKDDFVIVDARNAYESKIGHFEGALLPKLKVFRDFPKVLKLLRGKENKKVVLYCTGGVRCEKASAYLKEHGFRNVFQVDGGIITYIKNSGKHWVGRNFVFDKRILKTEYATGSPIATTITGDAGDTYMNCESPLCNELVLVTTKDKVLFEGCCSVKCMWIKRYFQFVRNFPIKTGFMPVYLKIRRKLKYS